MHISQWRLLCLEREFLTKRIAYIEKLKELNATRLELEEDKRELERIQRLAAESKPKRLVLVSSR